MHSARRDPPTASQSRFNRVRLLRFQGVFTQKGARERKLGLENPVDATHSHDTNLS